MAEAQGVGGDPVGEPGEGAAVDVGLGFGDQVGGDVGHREGAAILEDTGLGDAVGGEQNRGGHDLLARGTRAAQLLDIAVIEGGDGLLPHVPYRVDKEPSTVAVGLLDGIGHGGSRAEQGGILAVDLHTAVEHAAPGGRGGHGHLTRGEDAEIPRGGALDAPRLGAPSLAHALGQLVDRLVGVAAGIDLQFINAEGQGMQESGGQLQTGGGGLVGGDVAPLVPGIAPDRGGQLEGYRLARTRAAPEVDKEGKGAAGLHQGRGKGGGQHDPRGDRLPGAYRADGSQPCVGIPAGSDGGEGGGKAVLVHQYPLGIGGEGRGAAAGMAAGMTIR